MPSLFSLKTIFLDREHYKKALQTRTTNQNSLDPAENGKFGARPALLTLNSLFFIPEVCTEGINHHAVCFSRPGIALHPPALL